MKLTDFAPHADESVSEDKAFEVIKVLFTRGNNQIKRRADEMIKKIGNTLDKPYYRDEIAIYMDLAGLSQRLSQLEYERLLTNKAVVGVGGQFSAGKSCFINSITGEELLPEGLTPTTSIATYIVRGLEDKPMVSAYTRQGNRLPLTIDQKNYLTHQMTSRFKFNISGSILSLGIEAPSFPLENTALLDTPGYTKPDGIQMDISDRLKSFSLLKGVDHLIWLIDADNGELTQGDIQFIKALGVKHEILFVVNKADKNAGIDNIVTKVRSTIEQAELPMYNVVPYSSQFPERYADGKNSIWMYLSRCDLSGRSTSGITEQISDNMRSLIDVLNQRQKEASFLKDIIRDDLLNDNVVPGNKFLPLYYFETVRRMKDVQKDKNTIIHLKKTFETKVGDVKND